MMRPRLAALLLIAVSAACLLAGPADARPRGKQPPRIAAFDSCERLVAYARRHIPLAPPRPPVSPDLPTPMPVTAPERAAGDDGAEDSSSTNVQEAGVDEPDTVKTDGRTLWALANGRLHAIDARAAAPRLLSALDVEHGQGATMLRYQDRVLVLGGGPRGARFTEVDVSDPAQPEILRTEDVDGQIVDARLTGRSVRVVVSSSPVGVYGSEDVRARPAGWLPARRVANLRSGDTARRRVPCRAVRRPRAFAGPGILTVYTVDLTRGLPAVDADAVFSSGELVYASPTSLYVATQRWEADEPNTALHRFDIADPDRTTYAASGVVPGTLLNQFALSEHAGVLRAASTTGWGTEGESFVTTFARHDGRLVQRGQVGGLGRGERIYAVRYAGDVGYVVTFRETDPLYTVDLSDPANPRVRGELKIPGYSAYLHPVGDDLLLGVGQEATEDGLTQGLQLSLFDVRDLAHPTRLQKLQLGARFSHSAVEWDHHAFLWWPRTQLAVLPIDSRGFTGAAGFRVARSGIAEAGRVRHPSSPSVGRSVVVGDRLLTVSEEGVQASGLDSFDARGWVAFPPAPDPPCCDEPIPLPRPIP